MLSFHILIGNHFTKNINENNPESPPPPNMFRALRNKDVSIPLIFPKNYALGHSRNGWYILYLVLGHVVGIILRKYLIKEIHFPQPTLH